MATTPNFNWATPDNTGLVKNGALDIRTLGDAIDSSLVDLKGGTTGQVLTKASNTDMDFSWVADATGIPATIFDAKGDIIAATAADTASRLAVGSNNQVLTADSSTATGLKWATPASSSPSFVGCSIYQSASGTNITNNTATNLNFDSEFFDTNGFHSTSTNTDRITIPTGYAGKYLVTYSVRFDTNATGARNTWINKNGTNIVEAISLFGSSANQTTCFRSVIIDLTQGDYLTFTVSQNSGGNLLVYMRSNEQPIQVQWLGA
jgi:hypothetical protein